MDPRTDGRAEAPADVNPVYAQLGVRPIIHCGGTKTAYGGSRMADEVIDAMRLASRSFVDVVELNRAVGRYIAQVTGAEAGMVTNGAASGVVLSVAACMTKGDVALVRRLPHAHGIRDGVVIQKAHRGPFSHMLSFPGSHLIEVGDTHGCLPEELAAALGERTVAVAYMCGPGVPDADLTLAETCEIAHAHCLPVIVDAAAMLPPKDNLRRFIREGADLVTISGGKLIGGPQASGMLFGRADLVESALLNASPHHAIGRPHKVSRETVIGLCTALKAYVESDEAARVAAFRRRSEAVVAALDGLTDFAPAVEHNELFHVPTAVIRFASGWDGPDGAEVQRRLLAGEPRIFILHDRRRRLLAVNPISLRDDEVAIVAERLRAELAPARDGVTPLRQASAAALRPSPSPDGS